MRILILPALLLLAACPGEKAGEPSQTQPPAVAIASDTPVTGNRMVPRPGGDPPDFADPRAMLSLDSLDWSAWETNPPPDRAARLRQLGIVPIRTGANGEVDPATGYDPNGERVEDFHFVDVTGDGVADVVYEGPWFVQNPRSVEALEGTHVKIYQVTDTGAVQVMDQAGRIQRIWKGRPGGQVSFRIYRPGCCAEPEWTIEYLRPMPGQPVPRWEGYHDLLGRTDLQMPTRLLSAPRRFTVANDGYVLRSTPQVKDAVGPGEEDWYTWEGRGNVMAEYGRGARGVALAEATDPTGRVWWFVRMDGFTPPRAAQTMEIQDHGTWIIPVDRLGWMSSRFLTPAP